MNEEIDPIIRNKNQVLVNRPNDQKVRDYKRIFKIKQEDSNTENQRYNAKLVTEGFTHIEGVDYNEIFSQVAKYTSIRILLALTAHFIQELDQCDVKQQF